MDEKMIKNFVNQYNKEYRKCKKEYNAIMYKYRRQLKKDIEEMWKDIVKQYYDQYKPTEVYHREYGFYDANNTEVDKDDIYYDIGYDPEPHEYSSIYGSGGGELPLSQFIFDELFMKGKRGNAEGLVKLFPWIVKGDYYNSKSTFTVSYNYEGQEFKGTPEEVVNDFLDYLDLKLEILGNTVWNEIYVKYEILQLLYSKQ